MLVLRQRRILTSWGGEHAFGNAIDVAAFVTADRRTITVERDFRRTTPATAFLRAVHDRPRAESLLFDVPRPDHDAAHHNDFHVDRGVRWTSSDGQFEVPATRWRPGGIAYPGPSRKAPFADDHEFVEPTRIVVRERKAIAGGDPLVGSERIRCQHSV
jgi:hypothetical protein